MTVVDDSLFKDSEASLRRLVLALYLLVTPVFSLVLLYLSRGAWMPATIPTLALCTLGFVWTLIIPPWWPWKWIFPCALVPITCCGIASVSLGSPGLVFMAVLMAPLAWSSILFDLKTVVSAFISSTLVCLWVVSVKSDLPTAVVSTLVFFFIECLVGWVIFGKKHGMTLARLESLERQLNEAEFTMDTDGHLTYANSKALELYGYSEAEMLKLNIFDLRAPVSQGDFKEQFHSVHNRHLVHFETVHRRKDATEFPAEVSSRAFWFQGKEFVHSVIRDLTAQKRAESFSQKLMFALDQAKWGVAITNEDGTLPIYLNREFARMHGYEVDELIGRPWGQMLDEDFRPQYIEVIRKTLEAGNNSGEFGRVRKDGSKFPAIFNATAIRDSKGDRQGIVVNLVDSSERKKEEAERLKSQKLESVGILAAGIAHDFNNLLAAIRGQTDLATIYLTKHEIEKAQERLLRVPALFDRAKALTSRLVIFAKGGSPVRSTESIGTHLKDWVELALVGSDIRATIEADGDLLDCECDANQIGQVISNLVINARQASPPGSTISVRAENKMLNGAHVAVAVSDQGVGIPSEDLGKIFDPFFTTKPGGSGLGLSVAHSIVKQHSGWIDVASEVGKGATFTVYLPSSQKVQGTPEEQSTCVDTEITGIAVVMDDEEVLRELVGEMLQLRGLEVLKAKDGQETLERRNHLLKNGKAVALYVLDLTVPGRMGGLETAEKLRRDGDGAPLLFMSGYSEDVLRLTAGQFPGAGWLPKPFTNTDLCTALGKLGQTKGMGQ